MSKSKTPFDLMQHKMYNKLLNPLCQVENKKSPPITQRTLVKNTQMKNITRNITSQADIKKEPPTSRSRTLNFYKTVNEKYPIGNPLSSEKLNRSKMSENTTVFLCVKNRNNYPLRKQKIAPFLRRKSASKKMLSIFIKVFIRNNLPKNRKIDVDKILYKDFNKSLYLLILKNIKKIPEKENRCKCLTLYFYTCIYTIFNKVNVKQMLSDKIRYVYESKF